MPPGLILFNSVILLPNKSLCCLKYNFQLSLGSQFKCAQRARQLMKVLKLTKTVIDISITLFQLACFIQPKYFAENSINISTLYVYPQGSRQKLERAHVLCQHIICPPTTIRERSLSSLREDTHKKKVFFEWSDN